MDARRSRRAGQREQLRCARCALWMVLLGGVGTCACTIAAAMPDSAGVLVAAGGRRSVSLAALNVRTAATGFFPPGHVDDIYSLVVTPDGETALSGSEDGTVGVWSLSRGQMLTAFPAGGAV